ncbi:MAG: hypothetical protein ACNYZI_03140, partial [Anaerolineales bacterium]
MGIACLPLHGLLEMTTGGEAFYVVSLRGARKGDVAISAAERTRLLRFARNDIKGRISSQEDSPYFVEESLRSTIAGISRGDYPAKSHTVCGAKPSTD